STMKTVDEDTLKKDAKLFLLELNIKDENLRIIPYSEKEEQMALDMYANLEKQHAGNKEYDVVLAGVNEAHDLKKAYPNYYVDMDEFIQTLEGIIKKA
ncbi:MAG: hypothetical protein KGI27_15240, partial [Thaumarchaeota archaeon]|nr:hypothetical protein [Nitrososphaerota archaeon]